MSDPPPSRLMRKLGTTDAVVIGLGSMLGAGVFSAVGPAAGAAGDALLVGLVLASVVATCNATSSAQLAARHPEAGGAYAYGRRRLAPFWGFLAGWAFLAGKLASGTAMALTFARYVAPGWERPVAVGTAAALTGVNYFGVKKTVAATRIILAIVVPSLAAVVWLVATSGEASLARLTPLADATPRGVLQAGALLFFAFAGYARIATLGEEVVDPARTIPRAVPLALAGALVVYAAVLMSALAAVPAATLAASPAPLATVVEEVGSPALAVIPRIGAAVASVGVLLSLVAGMSRTAFAMADAGDLPRPLAAVHPRYGIPHRAELLVGGLVALLAATVDLRPAIAFSSFCVLGYYGIANAAALTLRTEERIWPRALPAIGLAGCATLAFALPLRTVGTGLAVLAVGALFYGGRLAARAALRAGR